MVFYSGVSRAVDFTGFQGRRPGGLLPQPSSRGLLPPRWRTAGLLEGEGAAALGLSGGVEADVFRSLLRGFHPQDGTRLVHNAGSPNRRGGWDLTWSVPKSVSIAWSQAEGDVRQEIQAAVQVAVRAGIHYLETTGVVSRRGTDGTERYPARLVFAAFEHGTSRAQDPQLHVHTVLVNAGVREDGTTGTLDPRELYRHQMAAGALFRAEFAAEIEQRLNLRARRDGRAFELIGVDRDLIEIFSKRRAEIAAELRARGLSGAKAAEAAVFATRQSKEAVPRAELFARWQETGREQHWTSRELDWLRQVPYPERDRASELERTAAGGLQKLTDHDSHFSTRQLTQALAEEAQGRGLRATDVLHLRDSLLQSQRLIRLGLYRGEEHWTTPEMIELERDLLSAADAMHRAEKGMPAAADTIEAALSRHPELSQEQRRAIRYVCESTGGLRVVSGMAGTGKSTLFAVANEVWSQQGREARGACLAGKAASGLQEATAISSATIHRTLSELEIGRLELAPHSVLLVDEAAMVGTRQLATLVQACREAGASLVLCGDARQLQAIEAGGGFDALAQRFGAAELTEIRRQHESWARQAVADFADGNAAQALCEFDKRGLLSLSQETAEAMLRLTADWKEKALSEPQGTVILAPTNTDVYRLNALAQFERLQAQQLSGPGVTIGCEQIFGADRVVFTRNSARYGVFNGDLGTVLLASEREISVRLDNGQAVRVPLDDYDHVRLAYALTVHTDKSLG